MNEYLKVPTEDEEQAALFEWANFSKKIYPELETLYHITNEGKRSVYAGRKLKKEGLVKGMPDIHLPVSNGEYNSLYIELKRTKFSAVSAEQEERIRLLNKYGNLAVICYGWNEAVNVIEYYLSERRANLKKQTTVKK